MRGRCSIIRLHVIKTPRFKEVDDVAQCTYYRIVHVGLHIIKYPSLFIGYVTGNVNINNKLSRVSALNTNRPGHIF